MALGLWLRNNLLFWLLYSKETKTQDFYFNKTAAAIPAVSVLNLVFPKLTGI